MAVAALLSSACSADGNGELQPIATDQQPVAFDATMADGQAAETRAVANVMDETALKDATGGFGVFACYTGLHHYSDVDAQPDFMYNQKVTWDGSKWTYNPLKYWPNGEGTVNGSTGEAPHYVSFMAYAPYSDMSTGDAGYCIPSMSLQHELGNPWVSYRIHTDVTKQVDLLYATPLLDQSKQTTSGNLSFSFKHALACAGSNVSVKCSDVMKSTLAARLGTGISKIELRLAALTIHYTLTDRARLVLWNNGTANWQTISSGQGITTRDVDYTPANHVIYSTDGTTTQDNTFTNDEKGLFYIPMHLANHYQTALVTLTYEVVRYTTAAPTVPIVERTREVTATITLSDYVTAYDAGKKLDFDLNIHDTTLTLTAAISDWTDVSQGSFTAQ